MCISKVGFVACVCFTPGKSRDSGDRRPRRQILGGAQESEEAEPWGFQANQVYTANYQLILNQGKYRYKQLTIQVLLDRYRSPGVL